MRPGVTDERIAEWKAKYGRIFVTEFSDELFFIWRILMRDEYKQVLAMQGLDVFKREEKICQICVLYPENFDFARTAAGIPTLLAEQIMDKSGFVSRSAPEEL